VQFSNEQGLYAKLSPLDKLISPNMPAQRFSPAI